MALDGRPLLLNIAEIGFSTLARQCLNRRVGSQEELARQVELRTAESNGGVFKVPWRFMVATAEDKLRRWYEQVNSANKSSDSTN